ncbi:hypothetical protein KR215_008221 [Drosophila sulfurigaster]|nr:hypothetical protein KR215_008221 [Drosophila sulfurigaster]
MSCLAVLRLPYNERCMMIKKVKNCRDILGYFNYFEMMYCFFNVHDKFIEICVMLLFLIIAYYYLLLMSIVVDVSFMPVLKILSVKMHLSEFVAGATLFAFGASCPDFVANLLPIREDSAIIAVTFGDSVVNVLLCGGLICYMKPFKMDWFVVVRELLFLWLAVELLRYLMFYNQCMSYTDSSSKEDFSYSISLYSRTSSIVLLSVYLLYLIVIIIDLKLLRWTIKKLQREILELKRQSASVERENQLAIRITALRELMRHQHMQIRSSSLRTSRRRTLENSLPQLKKEGLDYEANRSMLHNKNNPKNRLLWTDFLETLNPIDATEWRLAGRCQRFCILIQCPMRLLVTIFVPVVDYELYKHGWSKLLNCTQIVTNPFFLITAVHSKCNNSYTSWIADFNISYSKWSLCLTVPLAIATFCHARTDVPPHYHFLFIVLSASSSLVIIVICSSEIEVLIAIVGIVCHLSEHFLNITFGSMGSAVINLMASYAMTVQGYEKLAFTGVFAGPFFNTVVSMGVAFMYNEKTHKVGSAIWLNGEHGDNCYIFIFITIVTTLWWLSLFNFTPRRSAAVFSWTILALFILYAVAVEWDIVHEITNDERFEPR